MTNLDASETLLASVCANLNHSKLLKILSRISDGKLSSNTLSKAPSNSVLGAAPQGPETPHGLDICT